MTAHPIELIAGIDDGIDLDQKDHVTRHIASCDTCRTVARTMQRIDGLISMPEPVLPLPERATPREGVRVSGWTAVVAVVLALAVALTVLVGSFSQTQVAATNACGMLSATAGSAGVGTATAKASRIELSHSVSGSWTACRYGDIVTGRGPWLLFRSVPTAGWEVRGLLEDLTDALGTQLNWGTFVPCTGDALTERWISGEGICALGTGQAMAVVAEPYFFVVTTPSPETTKRLADAIVAELRRRPWPPLSDASKIDACNVITRAAPSAGLPDPDPNRFPQRRHWSEIGPPPIRPTSGWIWNNACAFRDESGHDQHLWIRELPTTLQQATTLLPLVSESLAPTPVGDWVQTEAGMWLVHVRSSSTPCPGCPLQPLDFSAVALLDEPHFFAVTAATDEAAIRLARVVKAELKRP